MENTIITHNAFSIPVVENTIDSLQTELQEFATTQGRQDGQKQDDIPLDTFKITVKSYIKTKGQEAIDIIRQAVLVAAQVIHIKELEQIAENDCTKKQSIIHDKEHQLIALQRVKKTLTPDPFKATYAKWLLPFAIFVGLADGATAYGAFRNASYSTVLAFLTSAAITLVISVSHIVYVPWIKGSKSKLSRRLKTGIVLIVAFLFFFWISSLRASGLNNNLNIAIQPLGTSSTDIPPFISPWIICGISFVLFTGILLFALALWQGTEERMQAAKYGEVCRKICRLETDIKSLQSEISASQNSIAIQKRDARLAFDYVYKSITRVKHICEAAIASYKQHYARFHQTVPSFFTFQPELQYDDSLQLFETEKREV